jgi:hypothetical protein
VHFASVHACGTVTLRFHHQIGGHNKSMSVILAWRSDVRIVTPISPAIPGMHFLRSTLHTHAPWPSASLDLMPLSAQLTIPPLSHGSSHKRNARYRLQRSTSRLTRTPRPAVGILLLASIDRSSSAVGTHDKSLWTHAASIRNLRHQPTLKSNCHKCHP